MRRRCLILLAVLLLSAGAAAANSVVVSGEIPPGNAFIPKGTLIEAELITGVKSDESSVHDVAYFRLRQNVMVNGVVVLPAGTVGNAQVTAAKAAGFFGREGRIELKISSVQALNGSTVPLTLDIKKFGGTDDRNMLYFILAFNELGYERLAKAIIIFHGEDREIPAGTRFQVAVDADADLGCRPDRLAVVMVKRQ